PLFSADDIKEALQRRGPDSLGSKKVFLHSNASTFVERQDTSSLAQGEEAIKNDFQYHANACQCASPENEEPCLLEKSIDKSKCAAELYFIGATLQLRGMNPIIQPLVDTSRNILVYNVQPQEVADVERIGVALALGSRGEIFGGIHVSSDSNDAEVLMESLGKCCSCGSHEHIGVCNRSRKEQNSVPDLLSTIKGPWTLIYWQASSRTLWFGRDAFGRRSLLVHWPTSKDSRLLLSSVSPPNSIGMNSGKTNYLSKLRDVMQCFLTWVKLTNIGDVNFYTWAVMVSNVARADYYLFDTSVAYLGEECGISDINYWEELSCGVYSIQVGDSKLDENMVGEVERHEWTDPMLDELINWERTFVQPKHDELNVSRMKFPSIQHDRHSVLQSKLLYELGFIEAPVLSPSEAVLIALREAVMRRIVMNTMFKGGYAPVAVLFSGGLDSMILAALLDDCLDPKYEIDLLNVSFDNESAPDRISARSGIKELQRISPLRRWKLVEIDAELSKLTLETKHVMSLINPARTYMDLNIGLALWLAASGNGWVYEERIYDSSNTNGNGNCRCIKYKSEARILLVGSGADEQCAGYGRHKTKYRNGSWLGLHKEMKLDMQRIWKRNLGRDDRCIADNGKEARFPFLDEDVIRTLLKIPLWDIADLDQPSGKGDKKILREVAQLLGLHEAAVLPKRAIQFGSRIARESNRKNFGSNRAANQVSAGSVEIYGPSNLT
ncbi:hypothetical protein U1Q18_016713, partial [Sarracenia purpurea var. burkii]